MAIEDNLRKMDGEFALRQSARQRRKEFTLAPEFGPQRGEQLSPGAIEPNTDVVAYNARAFDGPYAVLRQPARPFVPGRDLKPGLQILYGVANGEVTEIYVGGEEVPVQVDMGSNNFETYSLYNAGPEKFIVTGVASGNFSNSPGQDIIRFVNSSTSCDIGVVGTYFLQNMISVGGAAVQYQLNTFLGVNNTPSPVLTLASFEGVGADEFTYTGLPTPPNPYNLISTRHIAKNIIKLHTASRDDSGTISSLESGTLLSGQTTVIYATELYVANDGVVSQSTYQAYLAALSGDSERGINGSYALNIGSRLSEQTADLSQSTFTLNFDALSVVFGSRGPIRKRFVHNKQPDNQQPQLPFWNDLNGMPVEIVYPKTSGGVVRLTGTVASYTSQLVTPDARLIDSLTFDIAASETVEADLQLTQDDQIMVTSKTGSIFEIPGFGLRERLPQAQGDLRNLHPKRSQLHGSKIYVSPWPALDQQVKSTIQDGEANYVEEWTINASGNAMRTNLIAVTSEPHDLGPMAIALATAYRPEETSESFVCEQPPVSDGGGGTPPPFF